MTYRGRVIVSEEAIRQFWPQHSHGGYIQNASIADGKLKLEWGAWTSLPQTSEIPLSEIKKAIADDLPDEVVAGNLPNRDSISLVFRGTEETANLKERKSNGDVHEFGILTSEGFLPS